MEVRVLTRDRSRAAHLAGMGLEIAEGDVRDAVAVQRAMAGARTVVSAIQGFACTKDGSPATIDRDGNHNLILAAREASVEHFVLVSVKGASPDHQLRLVRVKYAAEQDLRASRLPWTIIQPASYMETWCEVLGRPLLEKGKTRVFGRGRNPINWVSATDVAQFVVMATQDVAVQGAVIEVGGPENLTMRAFVDVFRKETGSGSTVGYVPPVAMRLAAVVMRFVNPGVARQIQMGVVMDTAPQAFDAIETRRRYPSITVTCLDQVVRRDFANVPRARATWN
jgi:uncharacterized protein YbjT (DUF2867 family)